MALMANYILLKVIKMKQVDLTQGKKFDWKVKEYGKEENGASFLKILVKFDDEELELKIGANQILYIATWCSDLAYDMIFKPHRIIETLKEKEEQDEK